MVVEGWLERAAAIAPARTAIETPRGSRSYAELLAEARAGADDLAARGARAGARVAIALPPGLHFAQALHACLLLGAVAVPVDLRLSRVEREQVAAGAAVVVEEPLAAARGGDGQGWGGRGHDGLDGLAARGGDGQGWGGRGHDGLDGLGQDGLGGVAVEGQRHAGPRGAGHDLDAVAVVIHTSGTTSAPRPIELSCGNLLWSALGSAVALGLDPRERWLCALPLSHIGGLSILVRSAIYATTAVVHERFETERVLCALQDEQITLVSLVATTLSRLLDAGLRHPPALRCALTGGGPVAPALLARAREAGVPVCQTYGLTESCSQATTMPLAAVGEECAGTPLFCTRVRIAADGEILLAGPTLARASLDGDGWLHTGDLGSLDTQSRLRVTGRKSDTIVSGGENVAPTEVEAVLEAHPAVLEAAVVARPDPQWGEAVTAIVVLRPGAELAHEPLRAHCAASLAPYKVPKRIVLSGEPLPRTRSGKLLRREVLV
jgi:O-succinylbenzoic acid--CoA ligase